MHRRSSRPYPVRAASTRSRRDSLLYLQPKAELEDEQRRRHELHAEHPLHELDRENEIFEMPDGTKSLSLPLQGGQDVREMGSHVSWQMPIQGRCEVMGDEYAQELESSCQQGDE